MDVLLRAGWLVTLGLAFTLVLRRPLRRWFGANVALSLWALTPLLLLAMELPETHVLGSIPSLPMADLAAFHVHAGASPFASHRLPWLAMAWLAGAAWALLRLLVAAWQLRACCMPASAELLATTAATGLDRARVRQHPDGPGVLWATRPRLLLPADFSTRFDATERALILRHEMAHLAHGDPWWSLAAEVLHALCWFHPLAWIALPRFRLDLELACDERVLRARRGDDAQYARTLLHSVGAGCVPAMIPWLAEPQLKERLNMIEKGSPTILRRRFGVVASTLVLLAGIGLAQARPQAHARPGDTPASGDLTSQSRLPPTYPTDALKNKEQGMVMLMVLVDPQGRPAKISVDRAQTNASSELVKAATDAAMQWRFNPRMENGKPAEGYARVPVEFSLDAMPDAAGSSSTKT